MRGNHSRAAFGLVILLLAQLACAVPSLNDTNEAPEINIPLGPQLTEAQQQTQVLESIFTQIETSYIHYETSSTNWASLRESYQSKIDSGLSADEFESLMTKFENEFPEGELLYASREERVENDTAISTAGYGGIGAYVSFQAEDQPHVVILDVIPGSPAEKAGIQAHDSIYAIDGQPVEVEEGTNVVLRIRGEAGTKVTLTVRTPGKTERDVELTRAQITNAGGIVVEQLPEANVGYIRFPTAGTASAAEDVSAALEEFSQNPDLKGIIIDLRISGPNSNFPLEDMLSLFMDKIEVDIYSRSEQRTFTVTGEDRFGSQTIPLVVLVGEHSNGPAEVFAAAVQANQRGTVIGTDTNGSIEALTGFALPNGGQIFIASASFRISGEESLGLAGLSPKVRVEARWEEIIAGQDPVIQKAVESLEVQE